ncbi:MAG: hypothetical protein N5P05_003329 [Chroococcopsis gigantea SAG 12.99]|jgi:hypothetical protein|nr:PEP-CTERM sorting domain-containing protein [Chlorogloea purpurea SAG 13.99]MDV3001723.1 hypothetical protein [Chroococcopsis gigantea SAG 12.99]
MKTITKNQFLPLLAGISLAVGVTALAPSAQAAQLLSNLTSSVDGAYFGVPDAANAFTTGNVGLNLESIDLSWLQGNSGTAPRVGIFTDNSGVPSTTQVGGFFTNGTSIPGGGGTLTYTGSSILSPNTTYWLAIDILDNSNPSFTFSQIVTSNPNTQGANIPAGSAFGDISTGSWTADPANLIFALNGTPAGGPPPSTPEPSSLLALGLLGSGLLLRKRVK